MEWWCMEKQKGREVDLHVGVQIMAPHSKLGHSQRKGSTELSEMQVQVQVCEASRPTLGGHSCSWRSEEEG